MVARLHGAQALAYMLVKLVLVPGLMVGCAMAVGLENEYGRAAVVVASLPVSPGVFSLCKLYEVQPDVAMVNVVWGNLLVRLARLALSALREGRGGAVRDAHPAVVR